MVRGTEGPLARLFEQGSVAGMTDGQLLDRFTSRRGDAAEAAFEALVARHGPMVARVCRSCLRDEHDVEDAFQATFLVLVRRAGAIGERDLLAPWLYGVAHRVARKARAVAAKRRGREGGPADIDPPARADASITLGVDLGPMLHEEVDRLPAKYRQPVILCHLQGLTHAQAAQELAWPVGTVSVRLARARKILADRLARRGVTASVTVVAATLATEATAATLAPSWIHTAAIAALTAASGLPLTTAALSAGAITLARRTSMTMLLSSWKWLALTATVALTTATGAALVSPAEEGGRPQKAPAPEAAKQSPAEQSHSGVVRFTGQVTEEKRNGVSTFEAEKIVVNGKVGDLADMVGSLRESDLNATYQLQMSGGKVRYQPSASKPEKQGAKPPTPENEVEPPLVVVPPLIALPDGSFDLGSTPPPGYFNLPAPKPGEPGAPPPVRVGQTLLVEALEGLPGRPITGERVVRTDGTVSLGFYGDLFVVGLNRDQIKVKLIGHLRTYLSDNVLGLIGFKDGKVMAIPPVESNRVYIDDQPNPSSTAPAAQESVDKVAASAPTRSVDGPASIKVGQTLVIEVFQALPGRPISGERVVRPDGTLGLGFYGDVEVAGLTREQIKVKLIDHLRVKLSDKQLGLVKIVAGEKKTIAPADSDCVFVDDAIPQPESRTADQVKKLSGQVTDLSGKLDAALGAIEQLRRDRPRDAVGPPRR